MRQIELRYMASREWMESEMLAGRPVQRRDQTLVVDPDSIDPELLARVEAVADSIMHLSIKKKQRICVLDSGIDPELFSTSAGDRSTPMDAAVVDQVGVLPELPEPTDDVAAVVAAWEVWLKEYCAQALVTIKLTNANPPTDLKDISVDQDVEWGPVDISFGDGLRTTIALDDGPEAIRAVRAGLLWNWAAADRFSSESYAAAREATEASPGEGKNWLESLGPEELAQKYLERRKQLFRAAKAHHVARSEQVPDFEDEMKRWAFECGSNRLRLGIEDGYRMNARYLVERLAAEAPGMFAMTARSAPKDWAHRAGSPSEQALELRRRVNAAITRHAPPNLDGKPEAEIVIVKHPPHEMFLADPGVKTLQGLIGDDLPSREAWPWSLDSYRSPVGKGPKPLEAVVVKHWLGRFHLIGAVGDPLGGDPPGIWAIPDPEMYEEDGTVKPQDPDATRPRAAKRKPPETDEDIPF